MEPVVTVSLAGNTYALDQTAYDALRAYLDRAEGVLASNPDRAEVIRDLEQAIADKCANYLSAHKTVVSAAEMASILGEMGPVVGDEDATAGEPHASAFTGEAPKKKLFRLRDGAWIAGVCTGIAAYLNVDVTVVRIIAIILGLVTNGWLLLAYIIAMFVIPSAHTSEEWAAAHGVPFNAQEVIDQAKRQAASFAEDAKRSWRRDHRAWRHAMRERGRAWARHTYPPPPAGPPPGYLTRVFAGLFAFVFSVVSAALLIAFLIALFSFINTGAVLGWSPPSSMPYWLVIVIMAVAYAALSGPFSELRRTSYATLGGRGYYHHSGADGVIMLALIVLFGWFAYVYIPEAHAWMDQARIAIDRFALELRD